MRLKLIGVLRRSRPRKAPGRHTQRSIVVIIQQIIPLRIEFRYDGSSNERGIFRSQFRQSLGIRRMKIARV